MSREERIKSINGALDWFSRSYVANSQQGISEYYSTTENWKKPMPGVTAEIAGLLANLEKCFIDNDFQLKSVELADWSSETQLDCGAVQGDRIGLPAYPSVLRTAQAVKGWIHVYRNKKNEKSIVSAIRAGEWIVSNQDGDGSWRDNLNDQFGGEAKAYNIIASCALGMLWQETKIEKFKQTALRGLEWVLSKQIDIGWFMDNSSDPQTQDASLRNIGYTVLSLYDCGILFEENKFLDSAEKAVESMLKWQRTSGDFPRRFNHKNNPTISRHCVFGTAQIAKFCFLIYSVNKKIVFLETARKALDFLIGAQDLNSKYDGVKGAVPAEKNKRVYYAETVKEFIDVLLLDLKM